MLRLRMIRKAKGLSQIRVADAAEITPAYLCELEKGSKNNPGFNVLQKLAVALGVTVVELLDDREKNTSFKHLPNLVTRKQLRVGRRNASC